VDLAGGTLDLWPLYNFLDGAKTVNLAISISTQVELQPLTGSEIYLVSEDLAVARHYKNLQECLDDKDGKLKLLQVQLKYWKPEQGFKLTTRSQSPVGGGLGGSSSLTVSLLKAFDQWQMQKGNVSHFKDVHALVHTAHNLEAEVLNTPTGTQDYYPAASGGLNCLSYSVDQIEQSVLGITSQEIESHFMLVYTGKSHHSGINNFEVMSQAVRKNPSTLEHLRALKVIAEETWQACKSSDYSKLPELFKREYVARTSLAKEFTSPEIEKLNEVALQAGADAVKICGAGGGGCVLVWVSPSKRESVGEACQKEGFQVLDAKPVAPL
jgi:D-glycero-alpha-D-manno-heptose-7-phosphate kinase